MEKHVFYQALAEYMADNPRERRGQAAFNLMYRIFPTTADRLRGSDADPFYDDSKIKLFIDSCLPNLEISGVAAKDDK